MGSRRRAASSAAFRRPRAPGLAAAGPAILLLLLLIPAAPAPAQTQPAALPAPPRETVTAEEIQDQLKAIDGAGDLDEAAKTQLKETYQQALHELEEAAQRQAMAAKFDEMARSAASSRASLPAQVTKAAEDKPASPPADATVQQLEQGLSEKESQAAELAEKLAALEAEPKRRTARRKEIPGQLDTARQQLSETLQQLAAGPAAGASNPATDARQALLAARRQNLEAEIALLEKESAAYDATSELLPLERDLAAARHTLADAEVAAWQQQLNQRRESDVQYQLRRAESVVAQTQAALRPLAEENLQLAEEAQKLAGQIAEADRQSRQSENALVELQKRYQRTQDQEKVVGLTNAIGLLLRSERADLPDVEQYRRRTRLRQPEIQSNQLRLFELEDDRSAMASPEAAVQIALRELAEAEAGPVDENMLPAIKNLVESRRQTLDALIRDYGNYFNSLVELDNTEQRLVRLTDEYTQYIDERVLWIASAEPLSVSDVRQTAEGVSWALNPEQWIEVGRCLARDAVAVPLLWLLAAVTFGVLLAGRRRLGIRLAKLGETVQQSRSTRIGPTLDALLLTVLVGVTWPAILWFLGSRLSIDLQLPAFARAVGGALVRTAAILLPFELLRQICRNGGVAEAHFGWPKGSLLAINRNLRWLLLASVPLVFTFSLFQTQPSVHLDNSAGRLAYMAELVLVAWFLHRILRPSGAMFRHLEAERRAKWFCRFRHVWHAVGAFAPLVIALVAALGYYYTARQLADRLIQTIFLPVGLLVIGAFLSRWVLVARRRLAMERMRSRAAAPAAETPGAEGAAIPAAAAGVEAEPDLRAVSDQTRRMINALLLILAVAGIWLIWVDVFPALGILDKVPLWPTTTEVKQLATGPDGSITVHRVEMADVVSLADLALAILIAAVTLTAAKNAPGVLEIVLPRKLPLDAGARYAIATITRYVITIVGLLAGCTVLGLTWSKVQWLIAAVSVGLGFGLQEIFANFVSGLILLFERPIRVGDIVTIDDVTGIVSQIQIRATTVTNWDRQEFIVPNREFVTGRVLNWTRTDAVNRIVITVGVAYGSDTDRARNLLLEAARQHPEVMGDPAPIVTFEQFNESTLDLVLRCYLPRLDNRLQTIHDLHTTIHKTFNEAGIEIAFPQHDVHIRTGPPAIEPDGARNVACGDGDAAGAKKLP